MRPASTKKIAIDCPSHSPCIELAYSDCGAGPALILIHGLGGRGWSWNQQIEELSKAYRVIAMDLRGHGKSGYRVEEAINLRAFADDVIALLKALDIKQAHFCGHSLGGMIALEIFARVRSVVKSLILANTTAFYPPPQPLEEFLRLFDRLEMVEWARFMAPRLLRPGAPVDLIGEVVETIGATPRSVYRQALIAFFQTDYRWLLPLIDLPTLVLAGEEDRAMPWAFARDLKNQVRNASLRMVPNAAHLTHRENPQEFNRLLWSHLKMCETQNDAGIP